MPTPIAFTVTDAGRIAALDAYANGLSITLETLRASTGKVTPDGSETSLTGTLRGSWSLGGGEVNEVSATLRFFALVQSVTSITDIFSLGLYTDDDVLFAIASTTGADPLIVCHANIDFLPSFGISLPDVFASSVTIETDPNAPLAQVLMTQHQAALNPHPQYLKSNTQGTEEVLGMFRVPTTAQVIAGLADNLAVTPLKLKQNLDLRMSQHQAALNPHPQYMLSNTQGTEEVLGVFRVPTTAQVNAGLADNLAVTPLKLKQNLDLRMSEHQSDEDPHTQYLSLDKPSGLNDLYIECLKRVYPVGTPFFNKSDSRNPHVILGFGTWERQEGRVLVGFSNVDADFGTSGQIGGEKTHTLSEAEMPAHNHALNMGGDANAVVLVNTSAAVTTSLAGLGLTGTVQIENAGGGDAHNNLQPYVVYHWWVRTA